MKTLTLLFISVIFVSEFTIAQSNPIALRTDISILRVMTVRNSAVRMAKDPVSKNIFYIDCDGNVYKIIRPSSGQAYDTLIYTVANHKIDFPEDIAFHDSILYLVGNNTPYDSLTTGILRKGILQPNGTRIWRTVMLTEPFPTCGYFDHRFSSMALSPSGDSITINSGSRGDHGEVETNNGLYPNIRNVPLTAKLFRVSANDSTYLPNNLSWLAASGFVFAEGTRNTFSMAYDANGKLFGLENSGDRDHSDEMNWLRRGRHYGFPYCMGDFLNPQQCSTYNCSTDIMINHCSEAWRTGAFHNDPTFPVATTSVFEKPIQNIGPDCDKFRDTISGKVKDASDLGISIGTFTAHRSPLGLVFDNDSIFSSDLRGDAFMLSWTKGLDSTGGIATPYDTTIGPFVDPSQDLAHLHLMYDSNTDSYKLSATRIVSDFANPVDAKIDSNKIYVIENGYTGTSGLYEITMPLLTVEMREQKRAIGISCFPNPATSEINIAVEGLNKNVLQELFTVRIKNLTGQNIFEQKIASKMIQLDVTQFPNGFFIVELYDSRGIMLNTQKVVIQ
jgi:hypothetical protein